MESVTIGVEMRAEGAFSNLSYSDEVQLAELELSAFLRAVTELYGPDQARVSAREWLDESELIDAPPRSESRNWRAVTVAASARLADRLSASRSLV